MKKLLIVLALALFATSCDNDLFEDMPVPDETTATDQLTSTSMATRATSSEADFDPILELIDNRIPINFINLGSSRYKYLRYYSSGVDVRLTNDESEYCRWILTRNLGMWNQTIYCAARFDDGNLLIIAPKDVFAKELTPAVLKKIQKPTTGSEFTGSLASIPNTKHYKIGHTYYDPDDVMKMKSLLLQCESTVGNGMVYKNNFTTTLGYWDISPAGKHTVLDIKYIETAADGSIPKIEYGRSTTINNPSDATISQKLIFSEKVTVSSIIREPEAISITTVGQVSEPQYDTNGTLNSHSTGTVGTMEFGSSTSYEKTIGDELTINVPPHTSVNVEVLRQTYDVTATYIASVASQIYGIKFRIKGTYSGRLFTHITVNVKNAADGTIIKTTSINKVIP